MTRLLENGQTGMMQSGIGDFTSDVTQTADPAAYTLPVGSDILDCRDIG